jgi:hypothetical protein
MDTEVRSSPLNIRNCMTSFPYYSAQRQKWWQPHPNQNKSMTTKSDSELPETPAEEKDLVGIATHALFGVDGATGRGFPHVTFFDEYGYECSIQESSRAVCENEDGTVDDPLGWIWLGIDDAKPQIMKSKARALGMELPPGEVSGWMPYPIPDDVLLTTRMHLNETQVRGLIARLTLWLETGSLTPNV